MPAGARSGLKPLPPLFPAASSQAWESRMGLTVAPSLAKSCSPRIRLGPWLRLFHRRRFSPPSVSALSASPRITQTPAHHPSCIHSPGGLPAGSLCGDRAPTAPGSAGVEQSRGLGVVISQTVMERCEGGQGGNTGSKQQPGLSGETGAPGASGNRGSHGPTKDVPEPPGGTCFIPRYVHRSQTGGGSKSSDTHRPVCPVGGASASCPRLGSR